MNILLMYGIRTVKHIPNTVPLLLAILGAMVALLVWWRLAALQRATLRQAFLAAGTMLLFVAVDWAMLAALPRLGLSYGQTSASVTMIAAIRLLTLCVTAAALFLMLGMGRGEARPVGGFGLWALWLLNLVILAVAVDALYFEPFALQTTHIRLEGPDLAPGRPLRILHLTDLHVERTTRRERDMLQRAADLQPDLILLTGDYLNQEYLQDARSCQETRAVLAQLAAPLGVYAVNGNTDSPDLMQDLFAGLPVRVLQDEILPLKVGGQEIYLVGVSNLWSQRDGQALQQLMKTVTPEAYTLLLYHTPDLAEIAAQSGVDLYLAGHTHGGQVRLPFYGAIVTMSAYGKRFEEGLYQVGEMNMYVSRGVGMEGLNLPRVRFLCPPEITLFELGDHTGP